MLKNGIKRKGKALVFISLISISIIYANVFSVLANGSSYTINLKKGTKTYEISAFENETIEENIANFNSNDYWFDGAINETGAKAKLITRNWISGSPGTYELFNDLILSQKAQLLILQGGTTFNYTERNINTNYTEDYQIWSVYASRWNFTTEPFNVSEPTERNVDMVIMKNPANYRRVMDEFNDWYDNKSDALEPIIDYYNLSLARLNASAFLWKLICNRKIAMAAPVNSYLQALVSSLRLNDTKVDGNSLIIDRKSFINKVNGVLQNYTVIVEFDDSGMLSGMTFKDLDDKIFFQFISISHSSESIMLLLIITAILIAGIVALHLLTRNRHR